MTATGKPYDNCTNYYCICILGDQSAFMFKSLFFTPPHTQYKSHRSINKTSSLDKGGSCYFIWARMHINFSLLLTVFQFLLYFIPFPSLQPLPVTQVLEISIFWFHKILRKKPNHLAFLKKCDLSLKDALCKLPQRSGVNSVYIPTTDHTCLQAQTLHYNIQSQTI